MNRYTLHVPINDNMGRSLLDLHAMVRRELARDTTGWTEIVASGAWHGRSVVVYESMTLYIIDCDDPHGAIAASLKALAARIKRWAVQDAVYLTRQYVHVMMI